MKLNYKEFGSGKPMIILHGLLGSLDNWQSLAKRFAENFHVFTVDQRNHGQSPHSENMDYDLLSNDLAEFITDHNLEKAILIGHSMGGKTAMKFALEHSDEVERLIVVDITPKDYPVHHDTILEALKLLDFDEVKSRKEVEENLLHSIHSKDVVLFLSKNIYWKEKDKLAFRFNLNALDENLDLISGWPAVNGTFEGRTLFIRGVKSNYITQTDEDIIRAYFPEAEIINLDSGHWVHAEKPDEFFNEVMNFIDGN